MTVAPSSSAPDGSPRGGEYLIDVKCRAERQTERQPGGAGNDDPGLDDVELLVRDGNRGTTKKS